MASIDLSQTNRPSRLYIMQAVTWWGQLLLAWATWDTIRGRRMGPKMVRAWVGCLHAWHTAY